MDLSTLPDKLPEPVDDGAAAHLPKMVMPSVTLRSTNGTTVQLNQLTGISVIYIYPMTGKPDIPLPEGWDQIPGARGCTPQSDSFRSLFSSFQTINADVYGLSSQSTADQLEAKTRLKLPFEILSDATLKLKQQLNLPTFGIAGTTYYRRLTIILFENIIEKVFYPIFPPNENASEVLNWLSKRGI